MTIFNKMPLFLFLVCYCFKGFAGEVRGGDSEIFSKKEVITFQCRDGLVSVPIYAYKRMFSIQELDSFIGQTDEVIPVINISERSIHFVINLIENVIYEKIELSDIDKHCNQLLRIFNAQKNVVETLNFLYEIYEAIDFLDIRLIDTEKSDITLLNIFVKIAVDYLLTIENGIDLERLSFARNYPFTKELKWELLGNLRECKPLLVFRSINAVTVISIPDGQKVLSVRSGVENGHQNVIHSEKLSVDGTLLITQSIDRVIVTRIIDGKEVLSVMRGEEQGHKNDIVFAELNFDGTRLVTQSQDALIVTQLSDGMKFFPLGQSTDDNYLHIFNANLNFDKSCLIVKVHKVIIIICLENFEQIFVPIDNQEYDILDFAEFNSNSGLLIIKSTNGKVSVIDLIDQKIIFLKSKIEIGHRNDINFVQLSSDNAFLITHSWDSVIVTDLENGEQILSVEAGAENGHRRDIASVQLSLDGDLLVTRSLDVVKVTNIKNRQELLSLTHEEGEEDEDNFINSAELSLDAHFLTTQSANITKVVRLEDKKEMLSLAHPSVNRGQEELLSARTSTFSHPNFRRLLILESTTPLTKIKEKIDIEKRM